ncbi:EF-P beta-lysylation protein EpmB [Ferrimonas lipolytica]|uniref:L-lysine 2,3-aminomutase n=1 Tax=Ferrimonas lipolytica TaxID=2724191 RepID=A0A6H1UJZ0_9GAMM|nr:EF-P beta-lysylation protein EpmB [Ferrimonas lipolytica]QIZ78633.1 EF-P beta-lysylation protein EpmB [Ferrimonas lipolytica]
MITRNLDSVQCLDRRWQQEVADAYSDPLQLLAFLGIDPNHYGEGLTARKLFPMRVPKAFAAKMEHGNVHDPLLQQVLPVAAEFIEQAGFNTDPTGEQDDAKPGLLHKYRSRVLLMLRGGCAINCRYCFRRHFPYQDHKVGQSEIAEAIDHINNDSNINELLLSGGDPLMARDDHLADLFLQLRQARNLKRIRIHTRLPVSIPNRITNEFINLCQQAPWQIILVLHSNHANEICSELADKLAQLRAAGVTLLNQGVMLKGINDNAQTLVDLSERLFEVGVMPYYMHQLDKVVGATHYEVSDDEARAIMAEVITLLPGFLVPKLVREVAGKSSKTPIDLHLS